MQLRKVKLYGPGAERAKQENTRNTMLINSEKKQK